MKHIAGYAVMDEDSDGHVEINLHEGETFVLYVEDAKDASAPASEVPMNLDEAQRMHEALGALLWQARQARES